MDCDDVRDEGGEPWVTVPYAVAQVKKKKHRSPGSKAKSKSRSGTANQTQQHAQHLAELSKL